MYPFFILLIKVFGIGETYGTLLIARAVQGIGSACIGVCGMSLIAQVSKLLIIISSFYDTFCGTHPFICDIL